MGKSIFIVGTGLVMIAGAAFGYHLFTTLADDTACCTVEKISADELTSCCCCCAAAEEPSGGIAVAGPVALFISDRAGEKVAARGAEGADPYAACCDLTTGKNGLEALTGAMAVAAAK